MTVVILCINVTAHPTAHWTAQQLVEAFPWDTAPNYLFRDRDSIYGETVRRRIKSLCIEEVVTAPRSPWQNPFVERIIGSIRRDCLDHVIVLPSRTYAESFASTSAITILAELTWR